MYAAFSCLTGIKGRDELARIPESVIEDIRGQINIVDVISQYVQLKKSGKNLFGLCPFHEETAPSFTVSEDKQIFHCFSCGRGGNVFKFIMDIDSVTFPEAVIKVAKFGNIPIDAQYLQQDSTPVNEADRKLRDLYQQAQQLYHHVLVNTQLGQPALQYLHQRGMTDETIDQFSVGFAPNNNLLTLFFKDKQVDAETLAASGLLATNRENQFLDRFVERVMFPIKDQGGQVIAFSGRALHKDPNQPKYLNSPETALFNKRKVLFNYDLAKAEIRQEKTVLLFEGFMDVISAFQAGVKNGVASMGTSLTDEQLYMLQRTTNHLVICYDGDTPGVKAANRAVDMLMPQKNLDIGVIVLPDSQDPDEYIKTKGAPAFVNVIRNSEQSALRFKLAYLKRDVNLSNDKFKFDYLSQALDLLKDQATPAEQSLYIQELANDLGIEASAIKTQLDELRPKHSGNGLTAKGKFQRQVEPQPVGTLQKPSAPVKYSQLEQAERLLLYYALHDESLCRQLISEPNFKFEHDTYQTIFELWLTFLTNHDNHLVSAFIDQLPPDMQNVVADLEMSAFPDASNNLVITDLLQVMAHQDAKKQLSDAQAALKIANETGNVDEQLHWTNEIIKLSRDLKGA
ncbi:DNA primase [Agrilactobacillus composti DSM 18527 = JCM 14202]|uniref:DNA primase n=1 Tax=Agrilactobacillus composti DSM 18527 = JCM 14202 TaxID=1423734 RepID=A0A0R1Y011_9LACO|nr:DNA primase [Agrilactobacillus composti DSM 18527 = JCM 14202]